MSDLHMNFGLQPHARPADDEARGSEEAVKHPFRSPRTDRGAVHEALFSDVHTHDYV